MVFFGPKIEKIWPFSSLKFQKSSAANLLLNFNPQTAKFAFLLHFRSFFLKIGQFFPNEIKFSRCPIPHCNWNLGDCINFCPFCKILVCFGHLLWLFLADFWLFEKKPEFLAEVRNFGLSGSTDSGKSEKVSFLVKIGSEKGSI